MTQSEDAAAKTISPSNHQRGWRGTEGSLAGFMAKNRNNESPLAPGASWLKAGLGT